MAAQTNGKGFRIGGASGYARAHFSEEAEDAIEDDEEGDHILDRSERATKHEAEYDPAEVAEGRYLICGLCGP